MQAVQRQLEELEERQKALEVFGVKLERELRGESGKRSSVWLVGGGFFNLFQSRGVLMIVIEIEFSAKSEIVTGRTEIIAYPFPQTLLAQAPLC